MTLSNCQLCKYLDRNPNHRSDIVCGLNPAYANAWKRLNSLDEYTLDCLPIDDCREFVCDPALEEREITLSLPFYVWKQLSQQISNSKILKELNTTNFSVSVSLPMNQWQDVLTSFSNPLVSRQLLQQGIEPNYSSGEWISVSSSCIAAIFYEESESALKIRFNKGYVYQYNDVAREVFLSLLNAESLGYFFNRNIKNCYRYQAL